jgi:hypothetical protein
MKKSAIAASIFTVGLFGFASSSFAGVESEFECDTDGYHCNGDDVYEVSVKCYPDSEPGWTGSLQIEDDDWEMDFEYDDEAGTTGACDASGELDLTKTEVKCTDAANGPGHKSHPKWGQDITVEAEMKLVDEDPEVCEEG